MKIANKAVGTVSWAVIAASIYFQNLPLWGTLPAWIFLAVKYFVKFGEIPAKHPMKQAAYLTAFFLIFGFPIWKSTMISALNLILYPSPHWLGVLLFSRSSLGLGLLYWAACYFWASEENQKTKERAERLSIHIKELNQHYERTKDTKS
jgi:hypothetical protein